MHYCTVLTVSETHNAFRAKPIIGQGGAEIDLGLDRSTMNVHSDK